MNSIRYKVTAITIIEILLAILCVYLASFTIIQSENDRRSVEMMDLLAQDTSKSFEEYATGIARSVDMVANLTADSLDSATLSRCGAIGAQSDPDQRTPEQTAELDAYLNEFSKRIRVEIAAVAEHTHGVETYYFSISPELSTTERGFYYSHVGRTGFTEQEPFDRQKLDPNDPDHSAWYFLPIQRGRPSWIGPFPATSLNEMLICSYVVPIYKSGTFIGLLGMDIPLDTIVELVSSIHVYDTGFACLLNADGTVIYHPELEMGSTLGSSIDNEIFKRDDSTDMLIRYKSSTGVERQMSFTTLSTGMKLVVVAPVEEINASSRALTFTILPIAIAVVLAIALLGFLVTGRLTDPLKRLTAASQRLADADYDVELNYKRNDEVGALTTAFRRMRDQIQEDFDDLNHRLNTDDLTGLPNQRHFFKLAMDERDRLVACGKHPVMLYFNLGGMKHYNRQYGFDEGDRLIVDVAHILARHFGKKLVGRFGQDHFAAVSDEENLENRLWAVLEDCKYANGAKSLPISVGIYRNDLGNVDVSVACDRAKYACDQRRGSYLSGFSYFELSMKQQIDMMRYIINHFDEALEKQWIQVYYQPIVRAVNGKVCDEEALSRWFDPNKGFISPGDFIPALEGAGLIHRLDLYVLNQALLKMKSQQKMGLTIVPHSINLSRSDFDSCDIVEETCARVDAAGIAHNMITIEITESIIGRDFDYMKEQIERFRQLGFPVWIDDFGSGYSSLDFLQSIEFDLIKFDMSFMRKLDEGRNSKIVLAELMRMATAMGVDTLCEGVETESQVRFLREIGCSKLQGYYYCKAISLNEIAERNRKGIQIGYENPEESDYFEDIGKVNLHDLSVVISEDDEMIQNAFSTVPMAIMEVSDEEVRFVRTNQSYRDFMKRYFWPSLSYAPSAPSAVPTAAESFFRGHALECCNSKGSRVFFDEVLPDGSTASCLMRGIRTNPVTGTAAIVVAILSIA